MLVIVYEGQSSGVRAQLRIKLRIEDREAKAMKRKQNETSKQRAANRLLLKPKCCTVCGAGCLVIAVEGGRDGERRG